MCRSPHTATANYSSPRSVGHSDRRRPRASPPPAAESVELRPAALRLKRRRLAERKLRQRLRVAHGDGRRSSARRRLPWAALLPRVRGISVLVCTQCAGPRLALAAIHEPAAIARVLGSLGLSGSRRGRRDAVRRLVATGVGQPERPAGGSC